jgi:prephenate dehydratase
VRAGYLGPAGTFTHEALLSTLETERLELVELPSIQDAVLAVHDGEVERALVPIENSLEGAVTATLDTLALEAPDVAILGELVFPIQQCLIARTPLALEEIELVCSHPQASGQCRAFLRERLPQAQVRPASSTAEAVRVVAGGDGRWAALGNRLAAQLYGARILAAGVQDAPDNDTRFIWLGPAGAGDPTRAAPEGWRTAIVFWGAGAEAPGWLVACLAELAVRGINLTRIESRPRKQALGRYMFFADLEGRASDPRVAEGLAALRGHVEVLRVLGSFPAASGYRDVRLA